jgi:hypothetical protein
VAVDAPCSAGWARPDARLGQVRHRMGRGGEAGSGRRIVTVVGGCAMDAALRADSVMKVVAVASGENI